MNSPLNSSCTSCINGYYLWSHGRTVCDDYCPKGNYKTINGEVALLGNSNACTTCYSLCNWCENAIDNCKTCMNNAYLVDNFDSCSSQYSTCKG